MERLKAIKEALMGQVEAQMGNLQCVDTEELGDAIDMIKDLEEAMYYCSITKAMKEKEEEEKMEQKMMMMRGPQNTNTYYYTERYMHPQEGVDSYRDWDPENRKIYYYTSGSSSSSNGSGSRGGNSNSGGSSGNSGGNSSGSSTSYYTERDYPMMRDMREGRSPMRRKMFMESKETHQDTSKSMKELETYMQELTSDIMEMVEKATPEEKMILQKKMNTLASKLQNV